MKQNNSRGQKLIKLKIDIRNLFLGLIVFSPFVDFILEIVAPALARRYVLFVLVYGIIILHRGRHTKTEFVKIVLFDLFLFAELYIAVFEYGFSKVLSAEFYGYILFALWLLMFTDEVLLGQLETVIQKYGRLLIELMIIFFIATTIYQLVILKGVRYFRGPFEISHILAYFCIEFYAVAVIIGRNKEIIENTVYFKLLLLIKCISIVVVLMSAVRSAALGLAILVAVDYLRIKSFQKKSVILTVGILMIIYVVYGTQFVEKIPLVSKTMKAASAGSITNGREIFSSYVLERWKKFDSSSKLFGVGIEKIRDMLYKVGGVRIHAHNDFVNILVGYGYFGMSFILIGLANFSKDTKSIWLLLLLAILMYYNGIFMYMYLCMELPIIKIALMNIKQKTGDINEEVVFYDKK